MLIIKNSARRRLEMALEFDELANYIVGGPLYAIYANDGAGSKVRSVMYPMETIYETHREHPELELARRFYEGLKAYFVRTDNPCRVYAGVQAIEYQMRAECGCSAAAARRSMWTAWICWKQLNRI